MPLKHGFKLIFPWGLQTVRSNSLSMIGYISFASNLVTTTPFGTTGSRLFSWHGGPGGMIGCQTLLLLSWMERPSTSLTNCMRISLLGYRDIKFWPVSPSSKLACDTVLRPRLSRTGLYHRWDLDCTTLRSIHGSLNQFAELLVVVIVVAAFTYGAFVDLPAVLQLDKYKTVSDLPVANVQVISIMHALHQLTAESSWQVIVLSLDTAVSQAPCVLGYLNLSISVWASCC